MDRGETERGPAIDEVAADWRYHYLCCECGCSIHRATEEPIARYAGTDRYLCCTCVVLAREGRLRECDPVHWIGLAIAHLTRALRASKRFEGRDALDTTVAFARRDLCAVAGVVEAERALDADR